MKVLSFLKDLYASQQIKAALSSGRLDFIFIPLPYEVRNRFAVRLANSTCYKLFVSSGEGAHTHTHNHHF